MTHFAQVDRVTALQPLATPALSPSLRILRASYRRPLLPHYRGNPYARETLVIQVILVAGGSVVVPSTPQTNFEPFFAELKRVHPALFQRILSPSGTAKAASTSQVTPIKEIGQMRLAGFSLPGDPELYGWYEFEKEAARQGKNLALIFQGNGLFFNRGSVCFDGERLYAHPDASLAEIVAGDQAPETRVRLAVDDNSLKRPLLFFVSQANGRMGCQLHHFLPHETYRQGLQRRLEGFLEQGVRFAFAASPPLVIPDERHEPVYLSLEEILSHYHANDVRHSLYCPYEGAVLLSAELGRAQCLEPQRLAASISGTAGERLIFPLRETLNFVSATGLEAILEKKGYAGRYAFCSQEGIESLALNPLEGVYSHLLPFVTRQGQFGLIQTSGTHGNITGNDGPTFRQLSAILRDLNSQPPFDRDRIVAAASGSQGNDVPNLVCRGKSGRPGLLSELAPETSLDGNPAPRGIVTTPRLGVAL